MDKNNYATRFLLCLLIGFSPYSYADCQQDVQVIKQGQSANCDGFLFSPGAESQAEQYRNDANFYKKYSDQLDQKSKLEEDENTVLQKRLSLYIDESRKLEEAKAHEQVTEDLIRIGCFSLGVIVTALIARNVR